MRNPIYAPVGDHRGIFRSPWPISSQFLTITWITLLNENIIISALQTYLLSFYFNVWIQTVPLLQKKTTLHSTKKVLMKSFFSLHEQQEPGKSTIKFTRLRLVDTANFTCTARNGLYYNGTELHASRDLRLKVIGKKIIKAVEQYLKQTWY